MLPSTTPTRSRRAATTSSRTRSSGREPPAPSGSAAARPPSRTARSPRPRSSSADSSSSRPRTWTKRARWPRDSHPPASAPSRCVPSRSCTTPSRPRPALGTPLDGGEAQLLVCLHDEPGHVGAGEDDHLDGVERDDGHGLPDDLLDLAVVAGAALGVHLLARAHEEILHLRIV